MRSKIIKRCLALVCAASVVFCGTPYTTKAEENSKNNYDAIDENQQDSSKLSVIIDLDGGFYADSDKAILEGYTNKKIALLTPQKVGYIFKGWEVVAGDCIITTTGPYYELNFNTTDGIIKPIWEYDGVTQFTPEPTIEPNASTEPNSTNIPAIRNISVQISLDGGSYYGESSLSRNVEENSSIVLFENLYLLKKKGFFVDGFSCEYGSCKILDDGKVIYTAPAQSMSSIDSIKVIWKDTNTITDKTSNIVYLDLNGGVYIPTGKSELAFKKLVGITEILAKVSDIEKDGYVIKGIECNSFNALCTVQDGNIVLKTTGFEKDGISLKLEWIKESDVTLAPTKEPTSVSTKEPASVPTKEPTSPPTKEPTSPPAEINTITPDSTPIHTETSVQTAAPTINASEPVKLTVNKNTLTIGVDEKVQIIATATQNAKITYKSEDTDVCGVTSTGKIIGRKLGMTQIIVSANGTVKRINIQVLLKPTKIWLTKDFKTKVTYTLKKGKTKQLSIYFYKNSYSNILTFKSSNTKIATVSSRGKVKAKKKGKCKITVKTYNGKKAVATIKVK